MTHRSDSAAGQDRFELRDECTAGPMQQSAAHGETAADVALQQRGSSGPVNESIRAGLSRPFLDPDGSGHATSRRLTAAPMNRRAGRALAHGLAEDV